MLPVLFKVGSFEMYSYGFMVVLGFFAGLTMLVLNGKRAGFRGDHMVDLAFTALLAGLLGARVLFMVTQWPVFAISLMLSPELTVSGALLWIVQQLVSPNGGFVFYGGLTGGLAGLIVRAKSLKIPIYRILDLGAPALALGHAVGRLGCFMTGCCFGRSCPADYPFGVTFNDPLTAAPRGELLYPAQLFDSLNALIVFLILQIVLRKFKKFDGQIFALYLILYGIGRWIVETYRGDDLARGVYFENSISTSQIISVVLILVGGYVYLSKTWKKQESAPAPDHQKVPRH